MALGFAPGFDDEGEMSKTRTSEQELIDLAMAMDAAGEDGDLKEVERLKAVFDEAFARRAESKLARGEEYPSIEDFCRVLGAYHAAAHRRRRQ